MSGWLWIAGAFALGALVGAGLTILIRRGNDAEQRLRRLRREFDQYQGEVGRHFSQTAEVLTRLRTDFGQLYRHTERGAAELVGEEALQRRLRELENGEGRHPTPAAPPPARSGRGARTAAGAAQGPGAEPWGDQAGDEADAAAERG